STSAGRAPGPLRGTSIGGRTRYTATGPFSGSAVYSFRVRANSYSGRYSAYTMATVTTPAFPNRPTLTSAVAPSDTTVALSWTDVAGESGFRVERFSGMSGTWTTVGTLGAGSTAFTDTGLQEATSYTYRVVATNAA